MEKWNNDFCYDYLTSFFDEKDLKADKPGRQYRFYSLKGQIELVIEKTIDGDFEDVTARVLSE